MLSFLKNAFFISSLLTSSVTFASSDPHWTYDEEWENLSNTVTPSTAADLPYAECGLGHKQSPIDLVDAKLVKSTNLLKTAYKSDVLTVVNNGHSIKVDVPAIKNSVLSVGSEQYTLLQYHVHAPSEHVIDGKAYPAEIHFVHSTPDGKLAVIGVFVDELAMKTNAEFQNILNAAHLSATPTFTANPAKLLPTMAKFYLYSGSLTTPPCTEGVNWYVLDKPIHITPDQLADFQSFYSENARKVQGLNGRQVLKR